MALPHNLKEGILKVKLVAGATGKLPAAATSLIDHRRWWSSSTPAAATVCQPRWPDPSQGTGRLLLGHEFQGACQQLVSLQLL